MRRVREWICLFLFRLVYPLSLLTCSLVRINGFSMIYGGLALISALVRRPTPSSITKSTGTFLFISTLFCGATFLAQSVFQIYVAVATDSSLENCSFLEKILRQLGLQKLGKSSASNATRLILPDVVAFIVSILVYLTSKALLRNETPILGRPCEPLSRSRLSKLMSQMVIFLGPGLVLILMAMCGISAPSLIGTVYFISFLLAITLWACGVQLGRWFALLKGAMLVFNILHLAATYISQMPFIQDLWNERFYGGHFHPNNTVLIERILGLKRLMYTNCTEPWQVNLYDTNMATDYLNVAFLVVFFFVTGIEIRSTGEERKSTRRPVNLEEEDRNIPTTSDRDSLRSLPSPTRNYNSIETGDDRPIRNEDWLSRRSSSIGSPVKESSRRFEAFKAVAVSIGQFVLRQSYVGTLIVMMTWSITYHSWMTMIFLLAACLIWMVPQKRKLCLRLSPLIVFYAECLLIISYIYGFNLTEGELPTKTPEGYDLSEIGFYKVTYPIVRLVVQVAFLLVFLFTLKYSQISEAENLEGTSLETLNALRRASIQATLQYSEIMNRFGNWVMSFLIKYWILVCSFLFLFMALQDAVVYRILYMVMFLCFIISFQISYNFWRMWEKLFWVVVIIYSMVILLAIYILQFKDVMEKVHNSTGMSYDLMTDIGFQKYGTKDLFVSLLTPTSFLIVTILHLHYFQTKFLAISDLERYRNSSSSSSPQSGTTEHHDMLSAATWKETFVRLVSFFHLLYNKLVVLIWRVLEVHMFKVVAMTIFAICAVDVCCPNVILVIAVLVLLPLGFNRLLSFIAMFFSSFIIVTRMVYQLNLISEDYFISNCTNNNTNPSSNKLHNNESVNGAHYFGFRKSESMFMEVRLYIILVLMLAIEKIISVHQDQYFNNPHNPKPKPGTIFPGISRKQADAGLVSCFKFLANYGFYKFGKEISLLSIVIVMVARMDAISLIHGFFLGLLFLLRRGVCKAIWPGYLTILIILLFVQYLACLGLPPILCIDYPWNIKELSDHFPVNLKIFLFLPDYILPPYSIKLIADFFQVLLVYLQLKVFWQENKPEMIEEGGSNENIISEVLEGRTNPTEDFVLFKDSYLDYLKIGVFYYSFWMTLLLLFISGTSRISLFCLGYLVGCFYFLWYGQDLLLKPINNLNRIWSCMLLYCYAVLMIKCALQVVGCAFMYNVNCLLIQCFDITCIPIYPYNTMMPLTNKPEPSTNEGDCHVTNSQTSIVWDCISFFLIYFLLRAYKSWYFQHVINELRVDNELASRGSELINEMTSKRVDTQKKFEANILNNIRLKVEKIRKQMQVHQSQKKAAAPYTDHYEVIRSGDYYMFNDMTSDPDEVTEDDTVPPIDPPRREPKPPTVAELFNTASVSGMEAAIAMWNDWQQRHGPSSMSEESNPEMELVPLDNRDDVSDDAFAIHDDHDDDPNAVDVSSIDTASQKSPALKKFKTFVRFMGIVCWSSVEQLIVFLTGISRDYVCISNNLKQEKLKRKKASMVRPQAEEPALIELELEGAIVPVSSPQPSAKTSSTDPMLEESRFRRKMPLPLKLLYAMFEVFLSHSELLCYFAMILNAMVYGSILSMVFPMAAFLWATLSCPRPTKAFWLLAIGYTESLIIIKYVFQFFKIEQDKEPKNIFFWASVLGVTKEDFYAAFDIFLLMCLFFHRSVLKQHGLWRDAETANGKSQASSSSPEVKDAPADRRGSDTTVDQSESSSSSTLRRRKVKKDLEELNEDKRDDVDGDDDDADGEKQKDGSDDRQLDIVQEPCYYEDDFENEVSRICCDNFLVQPIILYCKQLKDDTFRAATDVYVFMFLADVITFLIAIFGFSSFGPTDPSISGVMVTTVLKKNKIPSVLLGMLLVQFLFIIIDRAIYLRKQVIFKLIFQIFLVLLIHAWVFFGLPYISQKRFVENTTVQLWYFTKCIYLALSAYQVRCGYPTCILGNFLTKKYNYVNLYGFQLFLVIPFLHELRSLMDWMFTDTTLALTSWLQMEDIYSNVFCVKCNRSAEKRYKTPRGNKRAAIVKYGLGGAMLFLLIFIIWLPLLLFSMSNTIFEPNKPTEVDVTIKIAGYEKIFSMSTQELMQLNRSDFDYIYANFPASTRTFMSSYQENDCFNVTLKGESEGTWTISPPATKGVIDLLQDYNKDVIIQFVISFRRNPAISSEIASAQFEKHLKEKEEDKKIRKDLAALVSGTNTSAVNITNVFPRYLVVPASGSVLSADTYFPRQDEISDNDSLTGNLEVELKSDNTSGPARWWSVSEVNGSSVTYPNRSFSFTTFNERVAPSGVLSVLNNYGVYGLYLSFVLVISRFLRMYIQGLSYKIMYVELPDPQALLTLCQDIYMVRESREFRLEEELFAQLIFLYRSPETLFKVTKQKSE